jgi:hypothetical protein
LEEELARVASPDGRATVVVTQVNGGATTSLYQTVDEQGLLGRSVKVAEFEAATYDGKWGRRVTWTSPRSVQLTYDRAKEATLTAEVVELGGQQYSVAVSPRD